MVNSSQGKGKAEVKVNIVEQVLERGMEVQAEHPKTHEVVWVRLTERVSVSVGAFSPEANNPLAGQRYCCESWQVKVINRRYHTKDEVITFHRKVTE